jgi:hypothetical protein
MNPLTLVVVLFILTGAAAWAQVGHHEKPGGKPAQPAAADPSARSPGRVVTLGSFVSVQVNVDGSGQNIVGDAANEPSIAVDPNDPDKIVIGWRQFDSISSNFRQAGYAYSHDGGQTWTFPGVLTPGTFRSDPVLDFDIAGNFYYQSLKGDFTCDMFISTDSGVTWQGPIPAWGGDKNWLAVDRTGGVGQGNLYCTWTGSNNFTRSVDGGYTYMNPIPSAAYWGTISVDADSRVYVVGTSGSQFQVQRSSNAQYPGMTPSWDFTANVNLGGGLSYFTGPNPGGLLGQAWVATNPSPGILYGQVYLLGSVDPSGSDPLDVHFVRSADLGQTWSAPVRVNDDPAGNNAWQWFGTMSVAPNGRIDVVWNDTRNGISGVYTHSELYYSFSLDGGVTWAKNVKASPSWNSHVGWPQQDKIGDYYDMVSHNDGAHLAYAATFNGEQDVYYLKLCPDLSLEADTETLSASAGGSVNFTLHAGEQNAGRNHLLLSSASGTAPGYPLPGGLATLPLNWDALTGFVLLNLNTALFTDFLGVLDIQGQAAAQLNAPPMPPSTVGVILYFAFCLNNPFDFVSKAVEVEIVP